MLRLQYIEVKVVEDITKGTFRVPPIKIRVVDYCILYR